MVPETDVHRVLQWANKRNRPELLDEYRIEVDVAPVSITIFECRPPWRPRAGDLSWTRFPIARLRYAQSKRIWTLYWRDRHLKFHLLRSGGADSDHRRAARRDRHGPDRHILGVTPSRRSVIPQTRCSGARKVGHYSGRSRLIQGVGTPRARDSGIVAFGASVRVCLGDGRDATRNCRFVSQTSSGTVAAALGYCGFDRARYASGKDAERSTPKERTPL